MSEPNIVTGCNVKNAILNVYQKHMQRFSENSDYKSICPMCGGLLLMGRWEEDGMKLSDTDHCVICGQHYRYLDDEVGGETIHRS